MRTVRDFVRLLLCLFVGGGVWVAAVALLHAPNWLGIMLYVLVGNGLNLALIAKGQASGSNREAEEDSQDSSSGSYSFTVAGNTASTASTYDSLYESFRRSLIAGPGSHPVKAAPELEVVEGDVPILAHRSANLRVLRGSEPFGAVTAKGWFGLEADATCYGGDLYSFTISAYYGREHLARSTHSAPAIGCHCGFYALPPDLPSTYETIGTVTLLVELSGTVIEHEQGYRASHQSVVECQLPACSYCGAQADELLLDNHVMVEAVCSEHKPRPGDGQLFVCADSLAPLLGVPVTRVGRVEAAS